MYLKRNNIKKFWSVPRKGTKYVAVATHNKNDSIPLIVVIRDIFKVVKNKKELKKLINEKQIHINNKETKETNYPISLFDVISFPDIKKNHRATLSKDKKIIFEEIPDNKAGTKIFKVLDKTKLKGNKIQLNLMHGRNIISKEKISTNDSVVIDFKEDKIVKIIPMEKGKKGFVIRGKHAGYQGEIEEIMDRGGKKIAKISSNGEKINVWTKNIIVVE